MDIIYENKKINSYKQNYIKKMKFLKNKTTKNNLLYKSFTINNNNLKSINNSVLNNNNNKVKKQIENNKNKLWLKSQNSNLIYNKIIDKLDKAFITSCQNIDKSLNKSNYLKIETPNFKFIKNSKLFSKNMNNSVWNNKNKLKNNNIYNKTMISKVTNENENINFIKKEENSKKINIYNLFKNSKINLKLSKNNSDDDFKMLSTNSLNFKKDIKYIKINYEEIFEFIKNTFLKKTLKYKTEDIKITLLINLKKYKKKENTFFKKQINYIFDIYYKFKLITEEINLIDWNTLIKKKFNEFNVDIDTKKLNLFFLNLNFW